MAGGVAAWMRHNCRWLCKANFDLAPPSLRYTERFRIIEPTFSGDHHELAHQ
jgi:hypothetical protein